MSKKPKHVSPHPHEEKPQFPCDKLCHWKGLDCASYRIDRSGPVCGYFVDNPDLNCPNPSAREEKADAVV